MTSVITRVCYGRMWCCYGGADGEGRVDIPMDAIACVESCPSTETMMLL
jgi:hypothetical protein